MKTLLFYLMLYLTPSMLILAIILEYDAGNFEEK